MRRPSPIERQERGKHGRCVHDRTKGRLPRAGLEGAPIDEADLGAALARFDEVWAALDPAERTRALHLLIERIAYDGRDGSVAITFRANGIDVLAREQAEQP